MTASYDGVGKLGFGAMRLPLTDPDDVTSIDIEQLKAMVDEFIAGGGTYVDTAFVYHNGASETALREALVERYPRDAFTVATKCLAWACASKEEAQACLPTSLERLGSTTLITTCCTIWAAPARPSSTSTTCGTTWRRRRPTGSCATSASLCTTAPRRWRRF